MKHILILFLFTLSSIISLILCDDVVDDRVCDADSVDSFCRQKSLVNENSVDEKLVDEKSEDGNMETPKKPYPGCKKFRVTDFNETSPSIVYLESRGRLGNQVRSDHRLADSSTHFSSTC